MSSCWVLLKECQRQLAEARAALDDVAKNLPSVYDAYNHRQIWDQRAWLKKHADALKAAKGVKP